MIRVMVYDDNAGRCEGLELLINQTEDMKCVGTFENCANVLNEVERLHPDVILMDIYMPEVNGIEGLKKIRRSYPDIMVVMQTVFDDEVRIFDAIRSGAHGYFLKKTSPERLIEGIRDVKDGGAPMTPSVAGKVLDIFKKEDNRGSKTFMLTDREQEILGLLIKGMSYKMIAEACKISWHTVNSHCKKIYEKLHVHSAAEAVAKALDERIV
ncbi:MAG: response regulator transcription factor [Bacteroidetes bacterium]|nr:response regulator transcription factor [Bacteroidota bacterium]